MPLLEYLSTKLAILLSKPALYVMGWINSVIMIFFNDNQKTSKEIAASITASLMALPAVFALDSIYNFHKGIGYILVCVLGFSALRIVNVAREKGSDLLGKKIDKLDD